MKRWAPALVVILVLLVAQAIVDASFFTITVREGRLVGSLVDVLVRAAPIVIIATGMTLVIATGGVDLSVGSVAAIGGVVAAALVARPETSPLASILPGIGVPAIIAVALVAGGACGLFNGLLVSKANVQPIVATLLLMTGGRGVAQLLSAGQIVTYRSDALSWLSRGSWLTIPVPIWLALALVAIVSLKLRMFPVGIFISATGSNAEAARYVGISVGAIQMLVYGFCGACAALAGLIWTGDIAGADASNMGLYSELDAILAFALGGGSLAGGRFSLTGTAIGAVLMRLLTTMLQTRGVPDPVAMVVKGLLVVAVCVVQSPRLAWPSWLTVKRSAA